MLRHVLVLVKKLLHRPFHGQTIRLWSANAPRASAGIGFVTEELGLGIKCCEVSLSSASARTWDSKIKNAQKAAVA
jgi:hypothetical protein